MFSNSPSCHSNFFKRRLIYSGSGDALVNDISVIDFPPPANAVSADANTFACPVTAGRVIASAAAGWGSAADTYTYAALKKASSITAWCTKSIHSLLMLLPPLPLPTSYTSTSAQYVFGPPSSTFMLVHPGANDSSSGTCGVTLQLEERTATPWREEYAATTL